MRVVAFAPSLDAVEDQEAGGVTATGFPMTSCYVDGFPNTITVSVVVAVCAIGGDDYHPTKYIIATSPTGERVGHLEFSWHWPDNPPTPVKYRVFAHHVPMTVDAAGVYTLGLYDDTDGTDTEHLFPLPVLKLNPLIHQPVRP